MNIFSANNWLKNPADRDVIKRWTVRAGEAQQYALDIPTPPDLQRFEFLALGDTGDSEAAGPGVSPQDAVALEMASDSALPGSTGVAQMIVHVGDVVYMTGEHRLYDRNFRRPYQPFLTPASTVENLTFQIPFLPVPGNHDYYDLGHWAAWVARIPMLGAGLRALSHELFAFSLPEGGSDMGETYMRAFVDSKANTREKPLPYKPGLHTRLPNRYYTFQMGGVDFFALDSNTLDAQPPSIDSSRMHADAAAHVAELETRAAALDRALRRTQRDLAQTHARHREQLSRDPASRAALDEPVGSVLQRLQELQAALGETAATQPKQTAAKAALETAQRQWNEAAAEFHASQDSAEAERALQRLDKAGDEACSGLSALEEVLAGLPESDLRSRLLAARQVLEEALTHCCSLVTPSPPELSAQMRKLAEEALDVQRELALLRRRAKYSADDYDKEQIQWLEKALAKSVRERPANWRIVYLHHPLYTTIGNHCERPDVQNVRDNLIPILKERVHLVLAGHSHAFEWFRSAEMPQAGFFVTGGGGQISLRRSILDPRLIHRNWEFYEALRRNNIVEMAAAGYGPHAADGQSGPLYHYLRIEVSPEILRVHPVGVRKLASGYRREEPMPVFHAPTLPDSPPAWETKRLRAVEIRRDQEPAAIWE